MLRIYLLTLGHVHARMSTRMEIKKGPAQRYPCWRARYQPGPFSGTSSFFVGPFSHPHPPRPRGKKETRNILLHGGSCVLLRWLFCTLADIPSTKIQSTSRLRPKRTCAHLVLIEEFRYSIAKSLKQFFFFFYKQN